MGAACRASPPFLRQKSLKISYYDVLKIDFFPLARVARDQKQSSSAAAVEKGQLLLRALAAAPYWSWWVKSLDFEVLVRIIVPSTSCLAGVAINS